MKKDIKVKVIKDGDYTFLHILSDPSRLQVKFVLDRNDISQKFLFSLMDICYQHGFSCSQPSFNSSNDDMVFFVGTVLTKKWLARFYIPRLRTCVDDLVNFIKSFQKQLDFSNLDISMFGEVNIKNLDLTYLAALRDQSFNGSWLNLKHALVESGQTQGALIIDKCLSFEKENEKDIGFVGHKLSGILQSLEKQPLLKNTN